MLPRPSEKARWGKDEGCGGGDPLAREQRAEACAAGIRNIKGSPRARAEGFPFLQNKLRGLTLAVLRLARDGRSVSRPCPYACRTATATVWRTSMEQRRGKGPGPSPVFCPVPYPAAGSGTGQAEQARQAPPERLFRRLVTKIFFRARKNFSFSAFSFAGQGPAGICPPWALRQRAAPFFQKNILILLNKIKDGFSSPLEEGLYFPPGNAYNGLSPCGSSHARPVKPVQRADFPPAGGQPLFFLPKGLP